MATVVLLALTYIWPVPPQLGAYDFGPAFVTIFHIVVAIVGLLSIWLVYFIIFALHA